MELPIYSPVEQLSFKLLKEKKVEVWLKRDDLIHPLISGNKWRKLKYVLAKAREEKREHLVTFGGAYSNHLLATAAAAAKFGFKSTGWVRGEAVNNDTLFLCRLHGMELIFIDRETYRDKRAIFQEHYGQDKNAYFINEGGSSIEAALGCNEIIEELDFEYDHLFCACGTGTTAAGLINGLSKSNRPADFSGVPVFKNGEFIRKEIELLLHQPHSFTLHNDYHFGGYAKTTPELISFIDSFIRNTGILIEPVYTGKMLFALFDLIKRDYFFPGSRIVALHTGGLFGLLGMKERFTQVVR
jgi:1-aminocyclopropane-1-carboxylate deaminase